MEVGFGEQTIVEGDFVDVAVQGLVGYTDVVQNTNAKHVVVYERAALNGVAGHLRERGFAIAEVRRPRVDACVAAGDFERDRDVVPVSRVVVADDSVAVAGEAVAADVHQIIRCAWLADLHGEVVALVG